MKRRINSLILAMFFALPVCNLSVECRLDISPNSNGIYEMNIGQTVTFETIGYQKDKKTQVEVQSRPDKMWWIFSKEFLEKINSSQDSITLKAIKKGRGSLKAVGIINNQHLNKSLTILVK